MVGESYDSGNSRGVQLRDIQWRERFVACTRVQLSKHRHERNIRARHRVIPTRLSIIAIAGCVNIGPKGFTVIVFRARTRARIIDRCCTIPFFSSSQDHLNRRGGFRDLVEFPETTLNTACTCSREHESMRGDNRFVIQLARYHCVTDTKLASV